MSLLQKAVDGSMVRHGNVYGRFETGQIAGIKSAIGDAQAGAFDSKDRIAEIGAAAYDRVGNSTYGILNMALRKPNPGPFFPETWEGAATVKHWYGQPLIQVSGSGMRNRKFPAWSSAVNENARSYQNTGTAISYAELAIAAYSLRLGSPIARPNVTPPTPRFDLSNSYKSRRGRYEYGNPERGGGLYATIDSSGTLFFDVASRGSISGTDLFASLMNRLYADGVAVNQIRGQWFSGTNLTQYYDNLANGMTPAMAAANTWTGGMAARYGFTNIEIISGGVGGSVKVSFTF